MTLPLPLHDGTNTQFIIDRLAQEASNLKTPTAWTAPTPNAGFTNYASLAYCKFPDGLVALRGEIQCSPAPGAGVVIFTLPAGYRPSYRSRWIIVGNSGALREIGVNTNGDVVTGDFGTPAWINNEILNVASVSFRAA